MRRKRGVLVLLGALTLAILIIGGTSSASSDTSVVFRETYQRPKGRPVTSTDTFSVQHAGRRYRLSLVNGDKNERSTRVTSAVVSLNGKQILGPSDFREKDKRLRREVHLKTRNTLTVELHGSPGTFVTIVIEGKDNEDNEDEEDEEDEDDNHGRGNGRKDTVPPVIQGTANPLPNSNGWNNSDVTVSFTCSDASSGMASCSGPTTIAANGANQAVTGTAVDKAGNTATATVRVSLDKATPGIAATSAPAPNASGWNNSDVVVSFVCNEALSGVASCSRPTTVASDGAGQVVAGTVIDNAGNAATSTASVNLDKSSPGIVASATPAANVNGWNNTDVTVSFTCSDALSGVASCPSPASVTTPGASQAVNGVATDNAGNSASANTLVSLDKAGPTLTLSPSASTVSTPAVTLEGTAVDGLSGLIAVTCNGVDAAISGDDFSCTPDISEGPNTIQIQALDRAGNSTSTSTHIYYVAFVPPPFGPTAVTWIRVVGVTASGNSLTKTNGSALWNSGANSGEVLLDGYGFVEFTATETNSARIAGLGSTDSNQDYTDVDYGVLLRNDGSLAIYESGVHRGEFGSYAANDRLRVEVRYGVVRYLRNGVPFYTSPAPIRYPLRVDTAFFTPGATLTDVRVGSFVWTDGAGVLISGESLIKTGAPGWNAGAVSTNTIETGDGYLEFTATETNTTRIGGLGNLVAGVAVSDVQFGVLLNSDGTVEIMEGGSTRGAFGSYASGDRFRVELRIGVVRYYRNGNPFYTSLQTPSYPLRGDAALETPGATLTNVSLEPLGWLSAPGVYADGTLLIKTTADAWATASSSTFNLQSGDGYVEFTAVETNKRRGLGLKSGGAAGSLGEIDYLLSLNETGTVEIFELGVSRGLFGSYQDGDHFRIEIQSGIVRYRRNGTLLHSSAVSPSYPLHAEAALYSQGATIADVSLGDLVWTSAVNVRAVGRTLVKTSGFVDWDAGASSTRSTSSGYVEFTASEASTFRIAGLSNGDSNTNFTDIDFAILLRSNATVAIYEAGVFRGDFTTYVAGDRFRVEVQAGTVRYWKNGALLYTSTGHPLAALRVDTALNGANATLFNIVFR